MTSQGCRTPPPPPLLHRASTSSLSSSSSTALSTSTAPLLSRPSSPATPAVPRPQPKASEGATHSAAITPLPPLPTLPHFSSPLSSSSKDSGLSITHTTSRRVEVHLHHSLTASESEPFLHFYAKSFSLPPPLIVASPVSREVYGKNVVALSLRFGDQNFDGEGEEGEEVEEIPLGWIAHPLSTQSHVGEEEGEKAKEEKEEKVEAGRRVTEEAFFHAATCLLQAPLLGGRRLWMEWEEEKRRKSASGAKAQEKLEEEGDEPLSRNEREELKRLRREVKELTDQLADAGLL